MLVLHDFIDSYVAVILGKHECYICGNLLAVNLLFLPSAI
jgi:hypothetical protein